MNWLKTDERAEPYRHLGPEKERQLIIERRDLEHERYNLDSCRPISATCDYRAFPLCDTYIKIKKKGERGLLHGQSPRQRSMISRERRRVSQTTISRYINGHGK